MTTSVQPSRCTSLDIIGRPFEQKPCPYSDGHVVTISCNVKSDRYTRRQNIVSESWVFYYPNHGETWAKPKASGSKRSMISSVVGAPIRGIKDIRLAGANDTHRAVPPLGRSSCPSTLQVP